VNKKYIPKVGDLVYVDTSLFVTHGIDDFIGGLCEVIAVDPPGKENCSIRVKEDPDTIHSWAYLAELQEKLKAEFGQSRGYQRPDYRPEFNREE
jgi:hypothetical protein